MDSQLYIEYELVDPVSNRRLITDSREEAFAYYEKGWLVWEHHVTESRTSEFTHVKLVLTVNWNNNPEFGKD